jgi:gliding motility-associated-like protein
LFDTITWSNNNSISDINSLNPVITPSMGNQVFQFVAWLGITVSCPVYDSIFISIDPCSINSTSNAFSPNGDGINDVWVIDAAFTNPNNRVFIYNRWGNVLRRFENYDNAENSWDGTYNGVLVPSGTYYYSIELPDIEQTSSGWIYITY